MMNVTIGQFFPGDSFLYRLDPRTKLILTVALIVLCSSRGASSALR